MWSIQRSAATSSAVSDLACPVKQSTENVIASINRIIGNRICDIIIIN